MHQFFQITFFTSTLLNKQRKNPELGLGSKKLSESYVKNTLEKGYKFLFETEMTVTTIIVGVYRQQIHEEGSALNH